MYNEHFHFSREPFSIAPDPRFLYLSEVHSEALAHLMYGFANSGFVLVTGEVGTGKTTLLRNLIRQTPPDLDVAFILNPRLTVKELLETICEELGINHEPGSMQTVKQYIDLLNKHLLRSYSEGRSTVLIIDEAQNLAPAVLEQIRLLTNLETDERKLLRIILLGQPELGKLLERQELRQLAQRITARYHLESLGREDFFAYVAHRLTTAGGDPHIFDKGALRKLYRISRGIPRVINVLADRALLGAYVEGKHSVTPSIVARAAREVLGGRQRFPLWLTASVVSVSVLSVSVLSVSVVAMAWVYFSASVPEPEPSIEISRTETIVQSPTTQAETQAPGEQNPADHTPDDTDRPRASDREVAAPPELPRQPGNGPGNGHSDADRLGHPELADQRYPDLPEVIRIARPPDGSYSSQRKAYAVVFALWGSQYDSEENSIPCDFAPSVGLQCLRRQGGWNEINRLNLPVVVELWDNETVPYYAAVTATDIDGRSFQFNLSNEVYRITPKDLRNIWFGTYVVLWKTPPGYRGSLRNGDDHPSVGWLRGQLTTLVDSRLTSVTPDLFDDSLHDAVLTFQRTEGLLADGVVGPATWIRLADRLRWPTPKLHS
ncbi:MAG: AAA family ATPase [Gammaproteobacteria bacterium]|nr:AAA family ATPase [Gammaproteobacteria bacterium]